MQLYNYCYYLFDVLVHVNDFFAAQPCDKNDIFQLDFVAGTQTPAMTLTEQFLLTSCLVFLHFGMCLSK